MAAATPAELACAPQVIEFGLAVSTTSTVKVQVSKLLLPSSAFAVTVCCAIEKVSAPVATVSAPPTAPRSAV